MAAATSRALLGPSSERPSASTPTASPGCAASRGVPVRCGVLARCCWAVAFGFRAGAAVRAACFGEGAALTRGRTAAATGRGVVDGVELGGGEVEVRVVAGRSSTDRFVAVRDVEVVIAFLDTVGVATTGASGVGTACVEAAPSAASAPGEPRSPLCSWS